jgi:hypothetical protein
MGAKPPVSNSIESGPAQCDPAENKLAKVAYNLYLVQLQSPQPAECKHAYLDDSDPPVGTPSGTLTRS